MLNNGAQKVYKRDQQIPLIPFQLENTTILWLFFWFSQIHEAEFIKF